MRMRLLAISWFLFCAGAPASGQSVQPKTLEVPATAAWEHAETGMILPANAGGFARGALTDSSGGAERDVSGTYSDLATRSVATVYVYRTMLPNAPLWFDRSLTQLPLMPVYTPAGAFPPAITAFAPPKASSASGLRASFALVNGKLKSTALAIAPLRGWLIKVRMSSETLDAPALEARLADFIAGLRWPAEGKVPPPQAVPVAACGKPLSFKKAKIVRDDLAQVLINSVMAGASTDASGPVTYCREQGQPSERALYRPVGTDNSYVIALDDAGRFLTLGPALSIEGIGAGGNRRFSLTHSRGDSNAVLPSFNRLPSPEQALALAGSGKGSGISVTFGSGKTQ